LVVETMKNKNRLWTKVLASVAMGGVIFSGLTLASGGATPLITRASAGVDGGGAAGGGGGGGGGAGRWLEIPKSKLDNGSIQNIPAQYRDSAVCRNAIAYFAIVPNVVSTANATGGAWTYSIYGVGTGNGVNFPGGPDVATRIAQNVGWSYQQGADYLNRKNFICLDNPNVVTSNEWRYEVRDTGSSNDSLNEKGVHTLNTQISPQPINIGTDAAPVMKADPVGKENLNSQSTSIRTNFGQVWDAYNAAVNAPGANSQNIVAKFKPLFAEARAKDATAGRAELNLNDGAEGPTKNNREGLAEGGILNVREYSRTTTATASTSARSYQVWRCGWDNWSKSGWQPTGCQAVGGSINPDNLDRAGKGYARWDSAAQRARYTPTSNGQTSWTAFSTTVAPTNDTQKQTGFWQIISAHCNAPGFAALRSAMGADLVPLDSGDSTNEMSGLMRTKYYAQDTTVLPMGDRRATNPAQKDTSRLGFYDKECPFDCTPSKFASNGASADNGALDNVATANFVNTGKGLYGAKSSDNVNSSYSEMFRDNTDRTIRPDVWYPVTGQKGVTYKGEAPKTTMVSRWEGGTPVLGTEFNAYQAVKDANGKVTSKISLFDATKSTQPTQKNFDVAAGFASTSAGQVPGRLDEITVQSTWASTNGKPQSLQVAWEYTPMVTSKVPTTISFAPGGANVKVAGFVNRGTKVDGRCWADFGTSTTTAASKALATSELRANTGTGITTKFIGLDGKDTNSRNIVLNFVRGTSE
jgi:hypothetical protein